MEAVLAGGEDYEILATVPAAALPALQAAAMEAGIALTEIATARAGKGVDIIGPDGRSIVLAHPSFSHF
jgi:thiamine-monophosphate kinase